VHSYQDWSKLVHPEDLPRIEAKRDEAIVRRLPFELEFRILRASGDTRWMQARGGAIYDKNGNPSRVLGINIDITERKKAEELLTRRAKEIAALQKTLLEITNSQDLSLLLQNIVIRAAGLLNAKGGGLYLCEPERREVRCVVSYNTRHNYIGTVLKYGEGAAGMVAETGHPLLIDDYRTWGQRATIYEKDSPFTAVLSVPMTWGGEVMGVIHVLDDVENRQFMESDLQLLEMFASHAAITVRNARLFEQAQKEIIERMRVEEELRKREKEITFIAENVPALFSYLDANGCYSFINKRYEEWFNIPRAQIIGKHYKEVLGESVSEKIEGFVEAALRGEEMNFEAPLPYSRGGTRWVLAKYVPDIDDQRKVVGFLALVMDITQRKQAERERERLFQQVESSREHLESLSHRLLDVQEAERRDLVRKLHDEVGQDLTALSLNLNIVQSIARSQLPAKMGTNLTTRMDDSMNLVEKTIERIRDLMVELRPPVLDDYGLTAALHWYGKQFSERTGIIPVIELEELVPRLPLPFETGLFRIAQEALTNVSKYAKAKHVVLSLDEVNGEVQLTIADDGIGFDAQNHQEPGAKPEWGLINMRERAQAIGGDLFVETAPGKGTKIIVEVRRNH
jgi:PAS domain S-box-containing protein